MSRQNSKNMNSCMIKIPVTFILIAHTWVQASLKLVRTLLLGHTMSSSPGCMLRQQWNRMLSLYWTASRFVSSRLRAQLMYLREERDKGTTITWNDRDFRCTVLLTMEMITLSVDDAQEWSFLLKVLSLIRRKNTWNDTSSSLSGILWQHQCTHTRCFLCKSTENENMLS